MQLTKLKINNYIDWYYFESTKYSFWHNIFLVGGVVADSGQPNNVGVNINPLWYTQPGVSLFVLVGSGVLIYGMCKLIIRFVFLTPIDHLFGPNKRYYEQENHRDVPFKEVDISLVDAASMKNVIVQNIKTEDLVVQDAVVSTLLDDKNHSINFLDI